LMPGTASDVADPFKNLRAGAKWLRRQYDNFKDATTSEDRWKLAATAYTAGEKTVNSAQQIVREATNDSPWQGRDPNTFGGLTGTDAAGQSPLSVAVANEPTHKKTPAEAVTYVNGDVAGYYIPTIEHWLREMRL